MTALSARVCSLGLSLTLCVGGFASSVRVENSAPQLAEIGIHPLHFVATVAADEVLVVRSIRSEDGKTVLETEDVLYAADGKPHYALTLIEHALLDPTRGGHWIIHEAGKQQHLQGVSRTHFRVGAGVAELELSPLAGRARRHYKFHWEARVEKWSDVRARHAELPGLGSGSSWHHQGIVYPISIAGAR